MAPLTKGTVRPKDIGQLNELDHSLVLTVKNRPLLAYTSPTLFTLHKSLADLIRSEGGTSCHLDDSIQLVPSLVREHFQEQAPLLSERLPQQVVGHALQEVVLARKGVVCPKYALRAITICQEYRGL